MTMKTMMAPPVFLTMALIAGFLTGREALAHDKVKVTGSFDTIFVKADFLTASDGVLLLDIETQGSFELTVGDHNRGGIITFPHILSVPQNQSILGSIHGAAAMVFDDGTNCVGFQGGPTGPLPSDTVLKGKFKCSDGTELRLKSTNTEVEGGVFVRGVIKGKLLVRDDDDDDDDD